MQKQIVVLTGDMGIGKTTTCLQLAERARAARFDCAGVISLGRFADGGKVGIDLLNLRTQERLCLAEADDAPASLRTGRYRFDETAMRQGGVWLAAACPCDLLIIDELGPLELVRGEGWTNALDILRSGAYRLAVVVVRPSLVGVFTAAMQAADATLHTLNCRPPTDALTTNLLARLRQAARE